MVFSAEEVGGEFKLRDWLRGVTTPSPADPAMWAVRRVKGHLPLGKRTCSTRPYQHRSFKQG